ncbi:putative ribonuclease H-like domain-containing protein [Tanacetum coccineum]
MYIVDLKNIEYYPKACLNHPLVLLQKAHLMNHVIGIRRARESNTKPLKGIKREFSIARTPQQNGITKRRNRILIEAARTMLADFKLPTTFWAEIVNIACYVQNKKKRSGADQFLSIWMTGFSQRLLLLPLMERCSGDINKENDKDYNLNKGILEEPKKVWTLVDLPHGKRAIGTKWVYRNKKDERVARIEAIRLFLAYASFKDFVGFEDPEFLDRVYKVEKALYGLHQAPRACLSICVDDIIFGSTKKNLCIELETLMHKKFQMSSMGDLTFFFRIQVTQKDDGIFISQDKDSNEKKLIQLIKIHTDQNVTDLLTKAFDVGRFQYLIASIECLTSEVLIEGSAVGLTFYCSQNMVAFLDKSTESDGFEQIVDFLNAHPIKYALTVNPTIYTACIEQFWTTAKVQTVNGEVQIQALVDKKKVIITKISIRRDLQLADENGTECLPNATIFAELERMGYENLTQKLTFYKAFFSPQWKFLIHTILQCLSAKTTAWNEFSSTMASAIICLATNQKFNFSKYIFDNMVKNLEGGVKFLMYPRFVQVFLDKQVEGMSKHKKIYVTPSHTKVFANMKRQGKDVSSRDTPLFQTMMVQAQEEGKGSDSQPSGPTEPMADETENVESVPTHSNDPLLSGEDILKLNKLMELCTNLSQRVLDLENTKTSQDAEIATLKERVKKLERRNKSRTPGLQRLRKVGRSARIESPKDEGLGDQEDASKQGRKIAGIDADEEVTLIDKTQGRNDDNLMFDIGVLDDQEVEVEKVVSTAEVTTASTTTTTIDELTLAQTLIEIKAAKPKAVTTAATTTTTAVTRPKARGVVVQEPSEFTTTTSQPSQLLQAKDKGKAKMVEPEKLLKKKYQILINEEIAQRLQEELQAELEEEERLVRQKEEDANIAEWDNVQAMIDTDYELDARLQVQEQEELTIKERAEEHIRKPPTKAQKRSQVSTYLKHMAGYKQNQPKKKNYDEIQKLFDKAMTRVNMFVDMDIELVKESSKKAKMVQESSSKRAGEELESDNSKKQKLDENVEAEVDDEAEMKKHREIVPDDEVAIDAIPLATKPPIIVDWKIIKE